jgi:hypothetical protein
VGKKYYVEDTSGKRYSKNPLPKARAERQMKALHINTGHGLYADPDTHKLVGDLSGCGYYQNELQRRLARFPEHIANKVVERTLPLLREVGPSRRNIFKGRIFGNTERQEDKQRIIDTAVNEAEAIAQSRAARTIIKRQSEDLEDLNLDPIETGHQLVDYNDQDFRHGRYIPADMWNTLVTTGRPHPYTREVINNPRNVENYTARVIPEEVGYKKFREGKDVWYQRIDEKGNAVGESTWRRPTIEQGQKYRIRARTVDFTQPDKLVVDTQHNPAPTSPPIPAPIPASAPALVSPPSAAGVGFDSHIVSQPRNQAPEIQLVNNPLHSIPTAPTAPVLVPTRESASSEIFYNALANLPQETVQSTPAYSPAVASYLGKGKRKKKTLVTDDYNGELKKYLLTTPKKLYQGKFDTDVQPYILKKSHDFLSGGKLKFVKKYLSGQGIPSTKKNVQKICNIMDVEGVLFE